MIAPLLPKTSKTPPPFVAAPPVPKAKPPAPPPVPKKQEAMKIPPKEVEKTKPIIQEITKSPKPIKREEYYTIQTGAFHNLEYARDLLEMLKNDGFDAYLTKIEGKKRGTFYKVFVGHFKNEKDGTRFLKEKGILNNHPGSFVRKEPSFEVHQLVEGKIAM